jgi:transcriptional regulator with PAS, ATPase and Fis domain
MNSNILVSWLGNNDLVRREQNEQLGPLDSILQDGDFSHLYLLSTRPENDVDWYIDELACTYDLKLQVRFVVIEDPTNYADIYKYIDPLLSEITEQFKSSEITIQLTSGTPSMTAVSLLLGKAKYKTKFIQSTKERGVLTPDLPFDIVADFHRISDSSQNTGLSAMFAGETADTAAFSDIVTQSDTMNVVIQKAAIIAKRNVPVLVYGETGTGKELFAKAIHNTSTRAHKPLLILNCGAIPSDLIDTTLFGHLKGAFTGANSAKDGYFKQADGGTLFLDDFGELPLESQVRLLRVIQQGTFSPVGGTKEVKVDVRIIAATNKNLSQEVKNGAFREDLFYRIAIAVLELPPLRSRDGDIAHIADALLSQINDAADSNIHKYFSTNAIKFISTQAWPGNVRELQATILRATLWSAKEQITDDDVMDAMFSTEQRHSDLLEKDISQGIDINKLIQKFTKHYVVKSLDLCHGNKSKAAKMLGLKNYQTLNNWIVKYKIDIDAK